jgi:hypothetical protein
MDATGSMPQLREGLSQGGDSSASPRRSGDSSASPRRSGDSSASPRRSGDAGSGDPFGFQIAQRGFSSKPITVIAYPGQEIRIVVPHA